VSEAEPRPPPPDDSPTARPGSSEPPGRAADADSADAPAGATAVALTVNAREQALLLPLLGELSRALGGGPGGERYQALRAAVEAGSIDSDQLPALENFLEMGLQTGRFRARFGGLGEEALIRVFHQTPRGAAIAASVEAVSDALAALVGQSIEGLTLSARGPGAYAFQIQTDRGVINLHVDARGARIADVELAL
jgi:hypothetical protein